MKKVGKYTIYTDIEDTTITAWHYFHKYFVAYQTMPNEEVIKERLAIFENDPTQKALWEFNLVLFRQLAEQGIKFSQIAFSYLLPTQDYTQAYSIGVVKGLKLDIAIVEKEILDYYKNITNSLQLRGLYENNANIELAIMLKKYINEIANDLDYTKTQNYLLSKLKTENLNFGSSDSFFNTSDTDFYETLEVLQQDFSLNAKDLTIIQYFTRIKFLEKKYKEQQKHLNK